ncbi:PX domain-containing protein 1-like [Colossoma macropomum]|uniref:PX domain-containing protein 1-like n=1 Tax=Colossoma macropomum TaxID=42526 RepID=UPI001864B5D9|nr:PX domain-containing protein 1-like [Colossoma macropomum]XP_036453239.1 PX domain-containing protein 1-like [Colossoma macropomum]XP_036453240.1 PX domain-containing protein 1-like [Colossoma macropomum]
MDRSSQQEEQEEELFSLRRNSNSRRGSSGAERLWTELVRAAAGDGGTAEASILEAIQRIKESEKNTDKEETRLAEVEKILKNIISMSRKYSQSEAALTFFQTSSLDSVQPFYQSPITEEDIWRSNGFCLANTETILYDAYLSKEREKSCSLLSARYSSQVLTRTHTRQEDGLNCNEEPVTLNSAETGIQELNVTATRPQCYVNYMSFLEVEVCETDILE